MSMQPSEQLPFRRSCDDPARSSDERLRVLIVQLVIAFYLTHAASFYMRFAYPNGRLLTSAFTCLSQTLTRTPDLTSSPRREVLQAVQILTMAIGAWLPIIIGTAYLLGIRRKSLLAATILMEALAAVAAACRIGRWLLEARARGVRFQGGFTIPFVTAVSGDGLAQALPAVLLAMLVLGRCGTNGSNRDSEWNNFLGKVRLNTRGITTLCIFICALQAAAACWWLQGWSYHVEVLATTQGPARVEAMIGAAKLLSTHLGAIFPLIFAFRMRGASATSQFKSVRCLGVLEASRLLLHFLGICLLYVFDPHTVGKGEFWRDISEIVASSAPSSVAIFVLWRFWRRERDTAFAQVVNVEGRCAVCDYQLIDATSRCPECGTEPDRPAISAQA